MVLATLVKLLALCCMLQHTAGFSVKLTPSRALAPRVSARHGKPPSMALLPPTLLAEAVAMNDGALPFIIGGSVLATLAAGFPVFFLAQKKTEDAEKLKNIERGLASMEEEVIEEEDPPDEPPKQAMV